jgi:hypothetical protein
LGDAVKLETLNNVVVSTNRMGTTPNMGYEILAGIECQFANQNDDDIANIAFGWSATKP